MLVKLPWWAEKLFGTYRYKVLWGGRGSGKSYAVADALLIKGASKPSRILCAREFQNSLGDSVHHLLAQRINALGLSSFYEVQRETILGLNGTSFIFKGVRNNVQSIKSLSGITELWLEEAQTVSKASWDVLVPTIREPGSEIYVTFNPMHESDPTYQMFIANTPGDDAYIEKVNWRDNPHWPAELETERVRLLRTDPDMYSHVYEGECINRSVSQIFANKYRVSEFEPGADWDGPYFGLDFGFSQDPTAGVKLWIRDRTLYVEREAGGIEIENDDMAALLIEELPAIEKHVVVADNARPELISHLKKPDPTGRRPNLPKIEACSKGKGSVEDGISFMKTFDEIVVHSRCKETIKEFRMYSYKVDRLSGDVLTDIVDKWNHYMDAIRYALEKVRKKSQFFAG
jgi:phage terminase large subunit